MLISHEVLFLKVSAQTRIYIWYIIGGWYNSKYVLNKKLPSIEILVIHLRTLMNDF